MTACSEARRNANRQNAQRSTGPRTSEGKARSSRNALKHGFCSTGSSLTPLEDREAYQSYTAAIAESLRPATPLEEDLARRIADLSWRLRRVPDAESALLARDTVQDLAHRCRPRDAEDNQQEDGQDEDQQEQVDHDEDQDEDEQITPESPARLLAAAMSVPQNPYLTLQRYEQSLDRARSRALKELRQLQKDRRQNPQQDEEPPRRNEPTAPSPLQGEVSGTGDCPRAGWGEGKAPDRQTAPLQNEPTTPATDPSRRLRAFASSRLPPAGLPDEPTPPPRVTSDQGPMTPTGELRNEPNPPSVSTVSSVAAQNPQSQIQNQKSQIPRPPQRFFLTRSDLRPIPPTPGPARPASGSRSPAS